MRVFDASSIIYAWDNYPLLQFPGLWDWMAEQIKLDELAMPIVALDEVANKAPECAKWLKAHDLNVLEITNAMIQDAMRIKNLLEIVEDKYGSGVGENDLFIIATARAHHSELVTEEKWQSVPPKRLMNYKIPAVCDMPSVTVRWLKFIDYIKLSGTVFR
jgi:predicted nucleic acid-binding protein